MNTTTLGEQKIEASVDAQGGSQAPRGNRLKWIAYILLGLFLVGAVAASAGLVVWSNRLSSSLSTTQAQLASLQADYGKATTELTQANSALSQTRADLATANSDLAKARADLKAASADVAARRAQMNQASELNVVVEALVNGESATAINAKVLRTGDNQLISLWDTVIRTPNEKNYLAFQKYLVMAISTALK